MIEVRNLSKVFNDSVAVNNVSFDVNESETLVLLGTSGCGKTTTLRMINRLLEPTNGSISIDSEDIYLKSPEILRRSIGYVLQGYGLFPHYTVAENIAVVPKLLKWPAEKIKKRVEVLLNKLQLLPEQYCNVYPASLSGGQKQRVGLARALAADPPILLMDEPFGALDPLTRAAVRKEFKELDELKKKTIILVTHDVQEAFELADSIGLMDQGSLLQLASPTQLLFHPSNDFVRQFFKHQRLQLEWQSIHLREIWQHLPEARENTATFLRSTHSIWEAMEALFNNNHPVTAFDEQTGTIKELTFNNLQEAIQKQNQER